MAKIKNEIAVGIMFFISMIILGYFTIAMKDEIFDTHDYYEMTIEFPSIFGLKIGDNVKVLGVNSGRVHSITLENNIVRVDVKLFNEFEMYENYSIKIRSESLLTGKCIAIMPGYPQVGGVIYPKVDKTQLIKGDEARDLMAVLEDVVSENRDNIKVAVTNLRDITENLKSITLKIDEGEGTIGKLINKDDLHDNATNLVTELRESIEDAREQAPITSFIRAALTAL